MPYTSPGQLPPSVRNNLPEKAQEIYLGAFNSAWEEHPGSEETCAAIAWAAVKKAGYVKSDDGTWKRTQKESHEAILQLLDRPVGEDTFTSGPFQKTADLWNGIPMIFVPRGQPHPEFECPRNSKNFDPESFASDPEVELQRIKGGIVGGISNARVEIAGHPRLMGSLDFSDSIATRWHEEGRISDETFERSQKGIIEALDLIKTGKLSHSTGLCCPSDKRNNLVGEVIPNHLLVFEETETDQPKDRGATIISKMETGMDDKKTNIGRVMSDSNRGEFRAALDKLLSLWSKMTGGEDEKKEKLPEVPESPESPPKSQKDENMNDDEKTALEKQIEEMKTNLASKDTEIQTLKTANEVFVKEKEATAKAQKEALWDIEKKKLKPGAIHKPEEETALKDLFLGDPYAYMNKAPYAEAESDGKEEGQQHTQKGEKDPAAETDRILKQFAGNGIPGRLH